MRIQIPVSEQKPLAHKNINFCPTSKGGKTVAEKNLTETSPTEDLSGATCVCVWAQDKGVRQ